MTVAITLLLAILLDRLAGEPKAAHPLVAFGKLANHIELVLRSQEREPEIATKIKGIIAVLLSIVPFVALAAVLVKIPFCSIIFNIVTLYLCIGARSLHEHAEKVVLALEGKNLIRAREAVGMIVSRDTQNMDQEDICRATVESVLENGSDAAFAAIFWFLVLGAPGVVLYRLANTLDAMWGYKNERYLHFGWAAARLDDVLNFIPARLTAFTYCILGNFSTAMRCWSEQAPLWYSPNAGPVMAAGAGSLYLKLGGPAIYGGTMKERPVLGQGNAPTLEDIRRATRLVQNGLWLWAAVVFAVWSYVNA